MLAHLKILSVTRIEFHNSYISQRQRVCGLFSISNMKKYQTMAGLSIVSVWSETRLRRKNTISIMQKYVTRQCGDLVIEKCWRLGMKRISNEPASWPDWCEKCWCQFLSIKHIWNWGKYNFLYISLDSAWIRRFKWPTTISSERSLSLSSPRDCLHLRRHILRPTTFLPPSMTTTFGLICNSFLVGR